MIETSRIKVLLSTYNGARFLRQQMDSIISQEKVELEILIWDDGSSDETLDIIEDFMKIHKNIFLLQSSRVGLPFSYLEILKRIEPDSLLAFSDQDDIWQPRHLKMLSDNLKKEFPHVIFSNRIYADEKLNVIGKSPIPTKALLWKNALVENVVFGNTMMINAEMHKLLLQYEILHPYMHDSYAYLIGSIFGKVQFLENSTVKYRIHGDNALGIKNRNFSTILDSMRKFIQQDREFFEKAKTDLDPDIKFQIENFLKFLKMPRIRRIVNYRYIQHIYRMNALHNFLLHAILLLCDLN